MTTADWAASAIGARVTARARRFDAPAALTALLTIALAGAGAALLPGTTRSDALLGAPSGPAVTLTVLALGVAFLVADLNQALVEFRRQAHSFSLAGIPMLIGLLYCPPAQLVAARLLAAGLAFAIRRASVAQSTFTLASYLLDTAMVLQLLQVLVLDRPARLTLGLVGVCYLTLTLVNLIVTCLVLLVVRATDAPLASANLFAVLTEASALVALNTALGALCAVLLESGALGMLLLVALLPLSALAYRRHRVLRRRHESLRAVQQLLASSERGGSVTEVAGRLLEQIRERVHAERVELVLRDDADRVLVHVLSAQPTTDDADPTTDATAPTAPTAPALDPDPAPDPPDPGPAAPPENASERRRLARDLRRVTDVPSARGLPDLPAVVNAASADPGERRWLRLRGAHDAAVVPLSGAGVRGLLIAMDRVGEEAATFTRDDIALMQVLGGHLAVALRNTELLDRLSHEATHDTLTGLPNRTLLTDRLRAAVAAPRGEGEPRAAVLMLDLDRFKEVNDTLGHHVGDELLQVVATRLLTSSLPGSTVARLGGDEFAILLPEVADEASAVAAAERISRAVRAPVELPDAALSTAASIGVALAAPGQAHADVLRHADTAMYAAKGARIPVTTYTPALDAGRAEHLQLLSDLHTALDVDAVELLYQPKLDLAFGMVTGVEALVRWDHPERGPISPDVFVPLAESTGLIERLTQVVLSKALSQCRTWQDQGLNLTVAVNLSPRNVGHADLPERVAAALVDAALPAQKLTLEITESSVMGDPDRTVPTLERLAAIGVALSLDDFGTGYSSLSYLQRLPVREVKIDRSFILGLDTAGPRSANRVLVESIITLGASLGLRIVAEGVESRDAVELLRGMGCDMVQGYLVGRPMTAAAIPAAVTGRVFAP